MKNKGTAYCKPQLQVFPGLLVILLSLILTNTLFVLHPLKAIAAPGDQKVYDNYGLFNEKEIADLEEVCAKYGEEGKVDIVIVTDDLNGASPKKYLEDFYDNNGFGYDKEFGDAALLLIDMYEANRTVTIQGYGEAEYYINNDRIEYILDDVSSLLKGKKYYDAMEEFAKQAAYYMNESKGVKTTPASPTAQPGSGNYYGESGYAGPSDYYSQKDDNIFFNTFFQLGLAVIIGVITVSIMAANSGGRVTVTSRTYMDERTSGVTASRDDYLRTTVTKVKKPDNDNHNTISNGSRSSGGGGISSGGHSHSGGSRGF